MSYLLLQPADVHLIHLDLPLIHYFPLEFVQNWFALVYGNMRSFGAFMLSFGRLHCARMLHYSPVCVVLRPLAF